MTDLTQIQIAAKAICKAWRYNWNGDENDDQTAPDVDSPHDDRPSKQLYRRAALAVITALQEGR